MLKKAQLKRISIILSILLVLTLTIYLSFVLAFNVITEDASNPANGTITSNSSISLSWNISDNNEGFDLDLLKLGAGLSTNVTNYTLYKDALVIYNFDNRSALGENFTYVYDLTGHGYNGTIYRNGTASNTTLVVGKYGNAYRFNGLNGDYIQSKDIQANLNETGFTVQGWVNIANYHNNSGWQVMFSGLDSGDNGFEMRFSSGTDEGFTFLMSKDGGYGDYCAAYNTTTMQLNTWYYVVGVYYADATDCIFYLNGVLNSNDSTVSGTFNAWDGSDSNIQVGRHSYKRNFNGTVDDVIFWNRTLSNNEILQLYNSQYTQHDSQNRTFITHQSMNKTLLNSSTTTLNYNFNLCSSNSSGSEICSAKTITNNILSKSATANFSSLVGNVRNGFYGTLLQSPTKIVGGATIDTNCDGVGETAYNHTWTWDTILNGGMNYYIQDYYFDTYYGGLNNFGFENWTNYSVGFRNTSGSTGARSWTMNLGTNRNATMYAVNLTQAHSGNYALQINGSSGSGNQYPSVDFYGITGENYTFSIWLKGQGSIALHIDNTSYYTKASKSVTLTSTWTQYNVSYVNIEGEQTMHMTLDIGVSTNVTMDDYVIYKNNTQLLWWRQGNTTNLENSVKKICNAGKRGMILIWSNNPTFLANWSHPNCLGNGTGDTACPPSDYDIANNISLDAVQRVIQNNQSLLSCLDFEFKNEPYGTHSGACVYDSVTCALDYVEHYNQTYTTLKAYSSSLQMGGPTGFQMTTTPNILKTFFSNMSNRFDFVTFHPYSSDYKGTNNMYNYFINVYNNCTALGGGAGCERLINTEYNTYNQRNTFMGQSNDFKTEIFMALQSILNWNPVNTTMMPYHLDDTVSYFNCGSRYGEYPLFWSSISQAGLDNATSPVYYPSYTITQLFSKYCREGDGEVYSSYSDTGLIILTCKNGNDYNIMVMNNILTEPINATINVSGTGITSLKDSNGNAYSVSGGIVQLGILDRPNLEGGGNGGFLFLDNDLQSPSITINSPTASTYSTTNIDFNITLDEEGDTCIYSLNNFLTNYTMTKQGWVNEFKANKNVLSESGNSNVNFSCNDTSNNVNTTSRNLTVSNNQTWISSKSSITLTDGNTQKTTYHLASNLSSSTNVSLILTSQCPISAIYTSNSGDTVYSPNFTCLNNLVYLDILDYEPANSSNNLELTYLNYVTPPATSSASPSQTFFNQSNLTIPSATDIVNKIGDETKNLVDSTINKTKEISKKIWDKFSGIESRNKIIIVTGLIIFLVIFIVIIVAIVSKNNPKENAN